MLWTLAKALLLILPDVWNAVKEGRIRASSQAEVLNALVVTHERRVREALKARREEPRPDWVDPNDRSLG